MRASVGSRSSVQRLLQVVQVRADGNVGRIVTFKRVRGMIQDLL